MALPEQRFPSLVGRSVIVTGGGRGLGREMALALIEAGADVTITAAKSAQQLQAVQAAAKGPGKLITTLADAADATDCERVVAMALEHFGRVDCLVNNAGRGMRLVSETFTTEPCRFWQTSPEQWREIVDCNINGPFNMARAVTPSMLQQGFGKIINISTSQQTMVRSGYSPYGPSKSALEAMSRVWADDLAGTGVTVNVLLPGGATDTELLPGGANRRGADGNLLSPTLMREPVLWLCADQSNGHTAERYIARLWQPQDDPAQAAMAALDDSVELPRIM